MRFPDHFSRHAALYAAARPTYPAALFAFLAAQAPGCCQAWDVGCGNGQAALGLAAHFERVWASDASAAQIAAALPHPRVHYAVQAAEACELPAASVDAICVAQALHWFDHPRFFAECLRVMKPGAVFAAFGYAWPVVTPAIDTVFKRQVRDAIEHEWAPQNRLLWSGYRELALPFEPLAESAVPTFELRLDWSLDEFMAYVRSWSATRRHLERLGATALTQAEVALRPLWGEGGARRRVTMPLMLRLGRHAG